MKTNQSRSWFYRWVRGRTSRTAAGARVLERRFGPAAAYAALDEGRGRTPAAVEEDGAAKLGDARTPAEAEGIAVAHEACGNAEGELRFKFEAM